MALPVVETEPVSVTPGQARRTGRGHIDSFGAGRVCAAPECVTELSRYNPGAVCSVHDRAVLPVTHWTR